MNKNRYNLQPIYLNYKRNNKWLGIIDYKTLSIILGIAATIVTILSKIQIDMIYKIYCFLFVIIPISGIILINLNNENAIESVAIILKYIFSKKKHVYYTDANFKNCMDEYEKSKLIKYNNIVQ